MRSAQWLKPLSSVFEGSTSPKRAYIRQRLVLLGGGHAHALVLRRWAMHPSQDTELVLISEGSVAPYSGMLPGYVAGHYTFDEMHIDLRRLAEAAGAVFIEGAVTGIDVAQHQIIIAGRPSLSYDYASINVGSRPLLHEVPGAGTWAIPVKPVAPFLRHWDRLCAETQARPQRIVLVGGGAGGIELACAMRQRLGARAEIWLVHRGAHLLGDAPSQLASRLALELRCRAIHLELDSPVVEVGKDWVRLASGRLLGFDALFWVTQAGPWSWLSESGLALDARGFLVVDASLRCLGQTKLFAVGDCATVQGQERPKAGVFAVRQAPLLFHNLRASLEAKPLLPIRLQRSFLTILSLGDRRALARRGRFRMQGIWVWHWKDGIDRRFMRAFAELPVRSQQGSEAMGVWLPPASLSQASVKVLRAVAARLQSDYPQLLADHVLASEFQGLNPSKIGTSPIGTKLLQSLGAFPHGVKDPFLASQIACNQAWNEGLSQGIGAQRIIALAMLPPATESLTGDRLYQALVGLLTFLQGRPLQLVGVQCVEGPVFALGFEVKGFPVPRQQGQVELQVGDQLVLSKPLGTGILFAAQSRGLAQARQLDQALRSMLHAPQAVLSLLQRREIRGARAVGGGGLLGCLGAILPAGIRADIELDRLPVFPGVWRLAAQGVESPQCAANLSRKPALGLEGVSLARASWNLFGDPQTAGGLLLGVAAEAAVGLLGELQTLGFGEACIVGRCQARLPAEPAVRCFGESLISWES